MLKKCFRCQRTKEITQFYKHPGTRDGHLGKCKSCAKKDVRRRYYDPDEREKIIKYEQERFKKPERKAKTKIYQQKSRAKNPGKHRARRKISNAIRDGKLTKLPCEVCGLEKVEAHHIDYRKPLEVKWLCRVHHLEEEGKQSYCFNN